MNYYREFIKGYAEETAELYDKLKKIDKKFEMTEKDKETIEKIKREYENAELGVADKDKEWVLETDASGIAAGCVLLQRDKEGKETMLGYGTHKFKKAEKKYGITEKELLAIVLGVKRFDYRLRGKKFKVITDHRALTAINRKEEFGNERMQRWMWRLSG